MIKGFTGYTIKEDYDLKNLEKYGFYNTNPKDINPWWQCQFNIKGAIDTLDSELLVNKNNRKLLMECNDNCRNINKLNNTIEEMKKDKIFINND